MCILTTVVVAAFVISFVILIAVTAFKELTVR